MNLIQLRISFANAWRSRNSSGKTFPGFERLPWVTPAGLTYQERPARLWSGTNKAMKPHLETSCCILLNLRSQLKNGPCSSTHTNKKKKKDFSVPQVPVNIKLALSQAKGQNSRELSLLTVSYRAFLNSFGSLQISDTMLIHTAAMSEDKA